MARVFLSSAREDRPAMRRLAEALRRAGHEPRVDVDRIGVDGMSVDERALGALMMSHTWKDVRHHVLESVDALLIGYSAATMDLPSAGCLDVFWSAATAHKLVLLARLDDTPLSSELLGAYAFDLRREWWARDLPPLIAALTGATPPLIGRDRELAWLIEHLGAGAPVAVIGEAGIGKTALAAEHARRHAAEYPGGCAHASRDAVLGERWLVSPNADQSGSRLLIVDELATDDPRSLARYLERARSEHVVVTARERPAAFPGSVLELAPLSEEEALLLFERRAGPPDGSAQDEQRRRVVRGAGGIPRSLVAAADLYRRGWPVHDAATIAQDLAVAAPPGSAPRALVEGALPFEPRRVPIAWAARVGGVSADADADPTAAARPLEPAGLVLIDEPEVHLHPAAAEVLRRQVPLVAQRALRARAEEIVARHLSSALAGDRAVDTALLEHAEALARHRFPESSTPWQIALQERLAEVYRRRGDRPMSLQFLELTGLFAAQHHATHGDLYAIVEARRAELAAELGDLDGARPALAAALAATQRQPAGDGARWRDVDPAAYQGAFAAAVATAERLGDPASAARAAFLLADSYGRQGGWERAAPVAEQALRAARRAGEPLLIALAYRLLADVALHGSRYEDARASFEEAIRRFDELDAAELAATSRLLYTTLLLQLNRRESALRHAAWLRDYLRRAPADWPYHDEAEQALRLLDRSATATERER
jgi:tetratricopeptide (TPR) repeat protein